MVLYAGHCWRSRDELISDVLLWTPHMAVQKQDDQHEHTFSNYVRIQDVVLKTCLRRWTIGKSGERGSGISVLPARHDDDDDDYSTYNWGDKVIHMFLKGISPKENMIVWLEFELTYLDVIDQHVDHYTMATPHLIDKVFMHILRNIIYMKPAHWVECSPML